MASNHLEELVAQWYEWQGYFVRRNIHVGKLSSGGYACELDVVAFNPRREHLIHIETSLDASSWAEREARYKKKFDEGSKHIHVLFAGLTLPEKIDQVAIFLFGSQHTHTTIGGGRIQPFPELMKEIMDTVKKHPLETSMIPERFNLLRTLQFAAHTWNA